MKLKNYLTEMAYRKGGKADMIVHKIVYDWPDWYFNDVSIKELAKELTKEFKINAKKAKFILDIWGDFNGNRINMGEFKDFANDVLAGQEYHGP
jgi:hypothetical protein